MPLSPGARLGPYEVNGPIGAGGMGEVYSARDTRLDRTVALKVLPSHLSADPVLRQRFEREARAISQLSHPHICVLHDIGHEQGIDYIVMEHLEGETLSARLQRGALPMREALSVATQIADALDRAHRHGVVHRDLKPGNIMLTRSGAKLLDFGLARTLVADGGSGSPSPLATAMPTIQPATPLTAAGAVVGTFQYMAPEQLEGREADSRSDIFSFGMVVYEMASGVRPFSGRTQAALVAAILRDEPLPLAQVAPSAPPALDRVMRACLAKDPADRWQTMHDVMLQLQWMAEGSSVSQPAAAAVAGPARGRATRERIAWGIAGVAVVAALASALIGTRSGPAEPVPVVRASITPPKGVGFHLQGTEPGPARLSPDGRAITFAGRDAAGEIRLYVRRLDEPDAAVLTGTENASYPFWSPDGRTIAYFTNGALWRIPATGGPATKICDAGNGKGGAWNDEGTIVFAPAFNTPLHRVAATGGTSEPITTLDPASRENSHRLPRFLSDGRHFVFVARVTGIAPGESNTLRVGELGKPDTTVLTKATSQAEQVGSRLLYMQGSTLLTQPFDTAGFRLTGEPRHLLTKVRSIQGAAAGLFDASANGVLVYHALRASADGVEISWVGPGGEQGPRVGEPGDYFEVVRVAPDERSAAVVLTDPASGTPDLWLIDLERGSRRRLTLEPGAETLPLWSPDGKRIAYSNDRGGGDFDLYVLEPGATTPAEALVTDGGPKFASSWSPDGGELCYNVGVPGIGSDIWIVSLRDRKPRPFLASRFTEAQGTWSPDGRWLAYVSDESGRNEVHVVSYPEGAGRWQVSAEGGDTPVWSRDGGTIFWRTGSGDVMAAGVQREGAALSFGQPRRLFTRPDLVTFDVAPHSGRFLILTNPELASSDAISLVLNWPELIAR